jgi:hypothetical protein
VPNGAAQQPPPAGEALKREGPSFAWLVCWSTLFGYALTASATTGRGKPADEGANESRWKEQEDSVHHRPKEKTAAP